MEKEIELMKEMEEDILRITESEIVYMGIPSNHEQRIIDLERKVEALTRNAEKAQAWSRQATRAISTLFNTSTMKMFSGRFGV